MPDSGPGDAAEPLQTKTYRFKAEGTRPILQFELTSGDSKGEKENLTIELHSPMAGEIFEAKTSKGRLEVDRDGRVMYFCQARDSVSFTLFLGRSVVVTMSREDGEVTIQSPSKMLKVERIEPKDETSDDAPPTDTVRIILS